MNFRLQELVVDTSSGARSLKVQTTLIWKCVLGVVALVGAGFACLHGPAGIALAAGIVLLALLMAFFSNTLVIDVADQKLVLRSGIGPLQGTSTIPFDSIKMVTISDGGVSRSVGDQATQRPTYSLAVEITGKKHLKSLLGGISPEELVDEAHNLANACGKVAFVPSALQ